MCALHAFTCMIAPKVPHACAKSHSTLTPHARMRIRIHVTNMPASMGLNVTAAAGGATAPSASNSEAYRGKIDTLSSEVRDDNPYSRLMVRRDCVCVGVWVYV